MKKIFIFLAIIAFCNSMIRAQGTLEIKRLESRDIENGIVGISIYKDIIIEIPSNVLNDWKISDACNDVQNDGTYIKVNRNTTTGVIKMLFFTEEFLKQKKEEEKKKKEGKKYYTYKKTYKDFETNKATDVVTIVGKNDSVKFEFQYKEIEKENEVVSVKTDELVETASISIPCDTAAIQPIVSTLFKKEFEEQSKILRYGIGSALFLLLLIILLLFILKPSKRTVAKMVRSSVSDTSRQKYDKGDATFKESQSQLEGLIRRTAELENTNADLKFRIEILEGKNISLKENQSVSKDPRSEQAKGIILESQHVKEKIMFCDQLNIQKVNEACFKASSDAYCYYKIVITGNKAKYYINDNEKVQATLAQMATSLYEYTKYGNLTNGKPVSVFETVEPGELEKKDSIWIEKVRIKVVAK